MQRGLPMDSLTQKSSMSLTQENPESAYTTLLQSRDYVDHTRLVTTPDDDSSKFPPAKGSRKDTKNILEQNSTLSPQHTSNRTDQSTPHTYHTNDTGYIKLDFEQEQANPDDDDDDSDSQDASFNVGQQVIRSLSDSQEPQTPAAPVNPFQHKGNVMKAVDLFCATQPSSVVRPVNSPTSSRPSPNICTGVYEDFSSPAKQQSLLETPAGVYKGAPISSFRSSFKNISTLSTPTETPPLISRAPRVLSFDTGIEKATLAYEPRSYVPMEESQERRKIINVLKCVTDESDWNHENAPRNRKRDREQRIQRELSAVKLHKSAPSTQGVSSTSSEMEIPSTGHMRRRNTQENMIEECQNARPASDISPAVQNPTTFSASADESLPALPLQKLSSHRKDLKNAGSKMPENHDSQETIPDTSPLGQRLRSIVDLASMHFGGSKEDILDQLPGLTQDLEYNSAMDVRNSPKPLRYNVPEQVTVLVVPTMNSSAVQSELSEPTDLVTSEPEVVSATENRKMEPVNPEGNQQDLTPIIDLRSHAADEPDIQLEADVTLGHRSSFNQPACTHKETSYDADSHNKEKNPESLTVPNIPSVTIAKVQVTTEAGKLAEISITPSNSHVSSKRKTSRASKKPPPQKLAIARSPMRLSTNASTPHSLLTPMPRPTTTTLTRSSATLAQEKSPKPILKSHRKKRKSGTLALADPVPTLSTRSSKRQLVARPSTYKEVSDSENVLEPTSSNVQVGNIAGSLFDKMAFAVSYVKNNNQKEAIGKLILDNGGKILADGFDTLFEPIRQTKISTAGDSALTLSGTGKSLKFAAVIADEHSRKPKYVQALALGLPCISGRWIQSCIAKVSIIDWSPYLLCAGQSSVLGNAHRSRTLQPYSAVEAKLTETFAGRKKLLEGKSVLFVLGKGKAGEKRKTFNFLTRALGPKRIGNVVDFSEARRSLLEAEAEGREWDLLHVHDSEKTLETVIFGNGVRSHKRKAAESLSPYPKRIRVITDETMIQSLIFGDLVDD